jgi:phosphoenolpyruvate-protein phosphotransferase/dihydroxyacetone kinase phosphotransfer subunit
MVGLVLVSHSRALAQATVDLIKRTVASDIALQFAGGVGEDRTELGTDGTEILEAINAVYSDDGVLVLMDMGSAILSAETAKDFLDPAQQEKVRLTSAPLVEGAIAAAIQAQLGSPIGEVVNAAKQSLLPKQEHLSESPAPPPIPLATVVMPGSAVTLDLTIENEHGLHLRPAAALIKRVARFKNSQIFVENRSTHSRRAVTKSLIDVARLQIRKGDLVRFTISSPDPGAVVAEIRNLVETRFGEKTAERPAAQQLLPGSEDKQESVQSARTEIQSATNRSPGSKTLPISNGVAIGEPRFLDKIDPPIPSNRLDSFLQIEEELRTLKKAVANAAADFDERMARLEDKLSEDELAVFEAQQLIVSDPTLFETAEARVRNSHFNAAAAWHETLTDQAARQESSDDPYLRERAADFREVDRIVLSHLLEKGTEPESPFENPTILICDELSPALAERCESLGIVGVIQLRGGATSHGAIVARALGMPAIGGSQARLDALRTAKRVAIDGSSGELWLDPEPATLDRLNKQIAANKSASAHDLETSSEPALSSDGIRIQVSGNAGSAEEVAKATKIGADSIGLFRSEFLFQQFSSEPTEEQQFEAYAAAFGPQEQSIPLTVRLLDIGGDKPLKFLHTAVEANPFLGVRGIRLLLAHPEFFRTHLRVLLRLSGLYPIRLMIPMVTDYSEVIATKKLLEEIHNELNQENKKHSWPIALGIMVETPAAAIMADRLAAYSDFFSIGTNDLAQYLLCAERGNAALSGFSDALHPAVLTVCKQVVDVAVRRKIDVSICGEIASDPAALPFLLGIGLRSLSVNPPTIPSTKASIRRMSVAELTPKVEKILIAAQTAQEIRRSLAEPGQATISESEPAN